MDGAVDTPATCAVYRRRRPERTALYRAVQGHLETYLALARAEDNEGGGVPGYMEREFRRYLECGILAHGFARARCGEYGQDFLIAFSCKGPGWLRPGRSRRQPEQIPSRARPAPQNKQEAGSRACKIESIAEGRRTDRSVEEWRSIGQRIYA